mmetsp:Transcript_31263/g.79732  ORF Transcript_31263/g.79732 Transcript_31263/m.79732 type:complete len:304 (-) Transcript_31263:473-1384(-)
MSSLPRHAAYTTTSRRIHSQGKSSQCNACAPEPCHAPHHQAPQALSQHCRHYCRQHCRHYQAPLCRHYCACPAGGGSSPAAAPASAGRWCAPPAAVALSAWGSERWCAWWWWWCGAKKWKSTESTMKMMGFHTTRYLTESSIWIHVRLRVSQGLSPYSARRSTFSMHTGHVSFLPTMVHPRTQKSWKQCLHASCTHFSTPSGGSSPMWLKSCISAPQMPHALAVPISRRPPDPSTAAMRSDATSAQSRPSTPKYTPYHTRVMAVSGGSTRRKRGPSPSTSPSIITYPTTPMVRLTLCMLRNQV